MMTTLSPLTMMVPSCLMFSELEMSSASSNTRFICMSKPSSLPLKLLLPLNLSRTNFPRLSSRIFVAASAIYGSTLSVNENITL